MKKRHFRYKGMVAVGLFLTFLIMPALLYADDGSAQQTTQSAGTENADETIQTGLSTSFMANPASSPAPSQSVVLQAQPVLAAPPVAAAAPPAYSNPPPQRKKTPGPFSYLAGMVKSLFGH